MNDALLSSKSVEWATPQKVFDNLNSVFNFTLDPCCTPNNCKCPYMYNVEHDGLAQSWEGHTVFMNPPYGREIGNWVAKAFHESRHALIVGLLPARTDTKWWHQYVIPAQAVEFFQGRLHFVNENCDSVGAPFPSACVLWCNDTACSNLQYLKDKLHEAVMAER